MVIALYARSCSWRSARCCEMLELVKPSSRARTEASTAPSSAALARPMYSLKRATPPLMRLSSRSEIFACARRRRRWCGGGGGGCAGRGFELGRVRVEVNSWGWG